MTPEELDIAKAEYKRLNAEALAAYALGKTLDERASYLAKYFGRESPRKVLERKIFTSNRFDKAGT